MSLDRHSAGLTSTRVPVTAEQAELDRRAARDALAVSYLTRKGYEDLLPILGLDNEEPRPTFRRCEHCGGVIVTVRSRGRFCDKECATDARRQEATAT